MKRKEITNGNGSLRAESRETTRSGLIRFRRREKFVASRVTLNSSSLKLHQREDQRFVAVKSRARFYIKITNHLPGTPFYRSSPACRIYRRDVCWSMLSGNPSSSDLVTDLANGHHSTQRWWYSRAFPIRDAQRGHAVARAKRIPVDRKSISGAYGTTAEGAIGRTDNNRRSRKVYLARIPATFFLFFLFLCRALVIFTRSISRHLKLADNRFIALSLGSSGIVISRAPERCDRRSVLDLFPSCAFSKTRATYSNRT